MLTVRPCALLIASVLRGVYAPRYIAKALCVSNASPGARLFSRSGESESESESERERERREKRERESYDQVRVSGREREAHARTHTRKNRQSELREEKSQAIRGKHHTHTHTHTTQTTPARYEEKCRRQAPKNKHTQTHTRNSEVRGGMRKTAARRGGTGEARGGGGRGANGGAGRRHLTVPLFFFLFSPSSTFQRHATCSRKPSTPIGPQN